MTTRRSFATYIPRITNQVHSDMSLASSGKMALDALARYITKTIVYKSSELVKNKGNQTILASDIQSAVRLVIPGELQKHAVSEGTKAVTKFMDHSKTDKAVRKEQHAGLIISVSLVEGYLRTTNMRIAELSPVYLAAVIEYLLAEIIEISGNTTMEDKKKQITVRHIYLALENDDEFSLLIRDNNIRFIGGGVIPNIDARLLPKAGEKNTKKGKIALRAIRNYQKSTDLLFQKAPIQRLFRDEMAKDIRFASLDILQYLLEDDVTRLLHQTNLVALNSGREGIKEEDFRVCDERLVQGCGKEGCISDYGISRLARRAGVKRLSAGSYSVVKKYMFGMIEKYTNTIWIILENRKNKTVSQGIIQEAFAFLNQNVMVTPVRRVAKKKKVTVTEVDE